MTRLMNVQSSAAMAMYDSASSHCRLCRKWKAPSSRLITVKGFITDKGLVEGYT